MKIIEVSTPAEWLAAVRSTPDEPIRVVATASFTVECDDIQIVSECDEIALGEQPD